MKESANNKFFEQQGQLGRKINLNKLFKSPKNYNDD